jgi:hypothetical protein
VKISATGKGLYRSILPESAGNVFFIRLRRFEESEIPTAADFIDYG